jgi:hypothetical protein
MNARAIELRRVNPALARLSFLTIKSGNTLGRLEDWKIGYRFIQPSSLPIFQQQLPVLKIKIDHRALSYSPATSHLHLRQVQVSPDEGRWQGCP